MLSYQHTVTIESFSSDSIQVCPQCGHERSYCLADGRQKCTACRKVFTANPRSSRLPDSQLTSLAHCFWEMLPTAETAEKLSLNIKTVQRYFHQLRLNIAQFSTTMSLNRYGYATVSADLFLHSPVRPGQGINALPVSALIGASDSITVLMIQDQDKTIEPPFKTPPLTGWLYARDFDSLQRCQLDRIHCMANDADGISLLLPFWQFTKKGLIRYQGGFRHNFPLYLREMEFRYNYRAGNDGAERCLGLLQESSH